MISVINHSEYAFSTKHLGLLKKDVEALVLYLSVNKRENGNGNDNDNKNTKTLPIGDIAVALMGEDDIQTLNKQYLKKNYPTDILTFSDPEQLPKIGGDIALCPYRVLYYAFEDGREPVDWFQQTLLHGLLHLYGLQHNYSKVSLARVYREQERILKQIQLSKEAVNGIFKTIIQHQR